jgi:hypothetical protein
MQCVATFLLQTWVMVLLVPRSSRDNPTGTHGWNPLLAPSRYSGPRWCIKNWSSRCCDRLCMFRLCLMLLHDVLVQQIIQLHRSSYLDCSVLMDTQSSPIRCCACFLLLLCRVRPVHGGELSSGKLGGELSSISSDSWYLQQTCHVSTSYIIHHSKPVTHCAFGNWVAERFTIQ